MKNTIAVGDFNGFCIVTVKVLNGYEYRRYLNKPAFWRAYSEIGSVTVNVDNSNKNEAAGGNASGENTPLKDSSKKDSSGGSAEKTGAAGNTSAKAGGTSLSANAPKTGDDSNIGLWAVIAVLALLAGGASAGYAIYKARKKDSEDA